MPKDRYAIATEQPNPHTRGLDRLSALQIARKINAEDFNAARAVKKAAKPLAQAIRTAAQAFMGGHKIIFMGAGTSGRLGVLEAAECVPTFGVKPTQIIGLIAGGKNAMFRAKEGAEDDAALGAQDIRRQARAHDFVIGLTASGITPYVLGGLEAARQLGARTALITCNEQADFSHADIALFLPTGPEALCGSTRMKAGTATKMALNIISTGAMALCGKMYGNLMVDVKPTNKKLVARATRLIAQIAGVDPQTAGQYLAQSGNQVKVAIVMLKKQLDRPQAARLLKKANGFLAEALDEN